MKILAPEYTMKRSAEAIIKLKRHQKHCYDRHTRPLKSLLSGDTVLPGENVWSAGVWSELGGPQSYEVKVSDRNKRRDIPKWKALFRHKINGIPHQKG